MSVNTESIIHNIMERISGIGYVKPEDLRLDEPLTQTSSSFALIYITPTNPNLSFPSTHIFLVG